MQTKSIRHTFIRDGRFYFSRRVPNDLADHYKTTRIVRALGTSSSSEARRLVAAISAQLDTYWATIRLERMTVIGHELRVQSAVDGLAKPVGLFVEPTLTVSAAQSLYLSLKGKGRPKSFKAAADRATSYLIAACGEKPLDHYTRADALQFRNFLVARGLRGSSITRNFSHLNAIINFAVSENALELKNPFLGVYYDRAAGVIERKPIPVEDIRKIQEVCERQDDDLRWLIALVSDTGMRLAEAAGLLKSDFCDLGTSLPYVVMQPHPWRTLKTESSNRVVPLVGASFWAAKRITSNAVKSQYAFPRYNKGPQTGAGSASAALNKWIRDYVPKGCSMHSFRHSMRDRLRSVECPSDIVDQIGGWTTQGVGQSYGNGYPLDVKMKWMQSIETRHQNLR
ncbi:DUF6538 domain-containing protein [Nioella nitratireducens]|uniref:DUF6538 domain-containing protein n=1 Tax=Nioella nitratireducens TaxID=1287720 RepID=UPI0008FD6B4E|nr:DUF6538 domain-containing protein [Nioella nitratireducens]